MGGDPVKTKRAREAARPVGLTVALTPQQALWLELMPFYIREAWLLDERKLKEWLDLFTDDVLYFMPRCKNVPRRIAPRIDGARRSGDPRGGQALSRDARGPARHRDGL